MTRTTTMARTLKRQAVLLALAACLVAQTTEATAATRPEQLGSHKQRPEAGIIVQAGIIQSGWSRVSARSAPAAAGTIQQRRPETGVIQQRRA
jgi:hypothetical protein